MYRAKGLRDPKHQLTYKRKRTADPKQLSTPHEPINDPCPGSQRPSECISSEASESAKRKEYVDLLVHSYSLISNSNCGSCSEIVLPAPNFNLFNDGKSTKETADVLVVASLYTRSAKLHSHCCQPPHAKVVGVDSEEERRDGRISSQSDLAYQSSMGAWGRSLGGYLLPSCLSTSRPSHF